MFNMLSDANPDDGSTDETATTITHTAAAATTGISTLGQTYAPTAAPTTISPEIATAIQQLSANQTAMMHQMAVMAFASPPAINTAFRVPPVPTINVPNAGYQQPRG
jgi:hypothetical protein